MAEHDTAVMEIDTKTFRRISEIVYNKAGIVLGANKESLVSARVRKRLRALNLSSYEQYVDHVEQDDSGAELVELLNVISTNVTHFFRENRHFVVLRDLVRQWQAEGQDAFRIWCAASSTGEEPYSIAMTMAECLSMGADVRILATDISTKVLGLARAGLYEWKHIDKVSENLRRKYFRREKDGAEERYRVDPALGRMLTFARLNLAHPPFPMKGPFDVIFCRNVMIYFDNEVRRRLLAESFRLLRPGGYLMVGHAESLSGMLSEFKSIEPSIYIRP